MNVGAVKELIDAAIAKSQEESVNLNEMYLRNV